MKEISSWNVDMHEAHLSALSINEGGWISVVLVLSLVW